MNHLECRRPQAGCRGSYPGRGSLQQRGNLNADQLTRHGLTVCGATSMMGLPLRWMDADPKKYCYFRPRVPILGYIFFEGSQFRCFLTITLSNGQVCLMGSSESSQSSRQAREGAKSHESWCDLQCCGNRDVKRIAVSRTPAKMPSGIEQTTGKKWHSSKSVFSSGFGSSWSSAKSDGVGSGSGSGDCSQMQLGSSQSMMVPEPLAGWTVKEQKVLMDQIEMHQHSKRHHTNLDMLFEKTHQHLQWKSLKEIEACYYHVRSKQIAYFGTKHRQNSPNTLSRGSIDHSQSFLVTGRAKSSSPESKRGRRGSI